MAGTWGFDTDWNARALNREKINDQGTAREQKISNNLVGVRFLTFKRSDFTLSPSLSVEYADDTSIGENVAVAAGVESRSTRRFSREYDLFASYNTRFVRSDATVQGESGNHLTQDLNVSVGYSPTPQTRLSASQTFSLATGKNPQLVSNAGIISSPVTVLNSSNPLGQSGATASGYMRSFTALSAGWIPDSRLRVALTASEDLIAVDGQPLAMFTTLTNTVSYTAPTYLFSLDSSFYMNDGQEGNSYAFDFFGTASYRPNRSIDASLNARLDFSHETNSDTRYVDLQQKFNYYILKYNGFVRHLVELTEELNYTDTTITSGNSRTVYGAKRLTLGARYFPTARIYVAGFARYSIVDPGALTQQLYSASVGITYRKLQANLEYSYGNQTGDQKRYEKKLAANLRKYF
jgi:hypothetical protein